VSRTDRLSPDELAWKLPKSFQSLAVVFVGVGSLLSLALGTFGSFKARSYQQEQWWLNGPTYAGWWLVWAGMAVTSTTAVVGTLMVMSYGRHRRTVVLTYLVLGLAISISVVVKLTTHNPVSG
jgi:hypothetical protein